MKTCVTLLTMMLLADAALTTHATESLGLMVAVVSWMLLYSLLGAVLPKWRRGLRWFILFAGFAIGYGIDDLTDRGFHWFTGIAAVAAAGHFAGWTGAFGLLAGNGQNGSQSQRPTALGRPGCFNTSFAASILLAYLCQTTVSGLDTRTGLLCAFAVVVAGFVTWELGRSVKGRPATLGKSSGSRQILRWLLASAAVVSTFLLFAQVLPIAAEQVTGVTSLQVSGDSFDLPDMPDLDTKAIRDGQFKSTLPKRKIEEPGSVRDPIDSVDGLSGGFRQDVAGGAPERAPRLQEFDGGEATTTDSSDAIVGNNMNHTASSLVPDFESGPSATADPELPPKSSAFWSLPPALVWPFLLLAALLTGAVVLVLFLLRPAPESGSGKSGADGARKPLWDHQYLPSYLRDFIARAAELGIEKERGQTLREFLRTLRRRGVANDNFRALRDYHYQVQFDGARRNDSQERRFRRESRKWLQ